MASKAKTKDDKLKVMGADYAEFAAQRFGRRPNHAGPYYPLKGFLITGPEAKKILEDKFHPLPFELEQWLQLLVPLKKIDGSNEKYIEDFETACDYHDRFFL